ncbi:hypothetical protein SAMN05421505_14817 [Sinosporangium album]|uniref:Uncharacterized protein n=1 Tax=Sinosporangium album TaxID=504805 RepID=A0A1G8K813_9ACTN|nr:hypothetical protein SAMN05421505_14817 [Sinosporangium album]
MIFPHAGQCLLPVGPPVPQVAPLLRGDAPDSSVIRPGSGTGLA